MAKAPDVAAFIRAVLVDASGRRQPHVEFATGCLGVAQQRFCAWKRVTIFKPRDVDWLVPIRAASSACDKPARRRAERFGGYLKFRSQHVIPGEWSLVARCEDHCHAVMLCFYFHNFMRTQKTLAVIPAIAAGITDKVLHEVGCAALMNSNQAPALRGPYKKRVTEIEISN